VSGLRKHRRRKPYTAIGIRRVPCRRCGRPSQYQWQICSDGNVWRGLCARCDIALNRLVLRFIGDRDIEHKMAAYRARALP
jgi:hypothetical protein